MAKVSDKDKRGETKRRFAKYLTVMKKDIGKRTAFAFGTAQDEAVERGFFIAHESKGALDCLSRIKAQADEWELKLDAGGANLGVVILDDKGFLTFQCERPLRSLKKDFKEYLAVAGAGALKFRLCAEGESDTDGGESSSPAVGSTGSPEEGARVTRPEGASREAADTTTRQEKVDARGDDPIQAAVSKMAPAVRDTVQRHPDRKDEISGLLAEVQRFSKEGRSDDARKSLVRLGRLVASLKASTDETPADTAGPDVSGAGDLADAWKALTARVPFAELPPQVQAAAESLVNEYADTEPELKAILEELQDDDLGAVDRAAHLSRLGAMRQSLTSRLATLRAALN